MSSNDIILSLFDFSGQWSQPYQDAGYDVVRIDIKRGNDIYDFDPTKYGHVRGILAAPPCTDFAVSGARWFKAKDADGRTDVSVKLVYKTLSIIKQLTPVWWALENPVGRIHTLIPELGKPRLIFQPYEFGDPYRKRTCLWGDFNPNLERNEVEPEGVRKGQPDKWYSKVGGKSEKTKEYRSMTPPGFAQAFFEANP